MGKCRITIDRCLNAHSPVARVTLAAMLSLSLPAHVHFHARLASFQQHCCVIQSLVACCRMQVNGPMTAVITPHPMPRYRIYSLAHTTYCQ